MSKFIGIEMVDAVPMSIEAAVEKGYRVTAKDGTVIQQGTMGYEVTYEDGYKSWCPADVFEKNNVKIIEDNIGNVAILKDNYPEHLKRIIIEHNELVDRYLRLTKFINGDMFKDLKDSQKNKLKMQHNIMKAYIAILQERIDE